MSLQSLSHRQPVPRIRLLARLSIRARLIVGFGSLMLLTILITLVAFASIAGLRDNGVRMTAYQQFGEKLASLEQARLKYMGADDPQLAAPVSETIATLSAQEQQLSLAASTATAQQKLQAIAAATQEYQQAFSQLLNARAARDDAQLLGVKAGLAGQEAYQAFASTYFSELDQLFDIHAQLDVIQEVSQLSNAFAQIRLQALNYTRLGTPEAATAAHDAVTQLRQASEKLQNRVPDASAAALAQTQQSLQAFDQALTSVQQRQAQMAQAASQMLDSAQHMATLNSELQQEQRTLSQTSTADQQQRLLLTAALALIAALLAAWLIGRSIIRPLSAAVRLVEQVAEGDLRAQVQVDRHDEVGRLQQAIRSMTLALRSLAEEIGSSSSQVTGTANGLADTARTALDNLTRQQSETDLVATAMHEMAATIQEVARHAEQAAQAAHQADQQARNGVQVVVGVISDMDQLAQEIERTAQAVSQVQTESRQIGAVLDVIKAVAEQTNLLALNAAIEAARAGEAGRGFAVVADEVRGLAQRTQHSTQQIEELVSALWQKTGDASTAMGQSQQMTVDTVQRARAASQTLEQITVAVSVIQSMNEQIATAIEEQSVVAEDINRNVSSVRELTRHSVGQTQRTASSSHELRQASEQMHQQVARFVL
ncbi:methyl-accepting chemotaxis protein [Pokkaliibacter plantistimulans]|uniref:Methyl-accepting chemotaxis protein n=1 Tax=Proteobacteria bacterium 228 TaxID=2083153 RepID=A0A2S5KRP6_9PROT|nr:methyl-accepting chemotaxis protein [Pokkaliibacter plantistimulans]PPC77335.1 methyl-accepting chemotaxis protein [Pokkaliibacter plantistimulans]